MELPTKKRPAISKNPGFLIFFSNAKVGKTTLLAGLENCLIIDTEPGDGTEHVECMSVKARNMAALREIVTALSSSSHVYDYIAIDTGTELEEVVLELALEEYNKTPMGKSFKGTDVRTLPNGGGYLYVREAFKKVINIFREHTKHFILTGHTKDKMINKQGKELTENSLDLSGKLERIMCSRADAIGFLYRKGNQCILNFNGGGDTVVEARAAHLAGKEIIISEKQEDGTIKTFWDKVYLK